MIATRRPLRLACAAARRAGSGLRVRAIVSLPLRWRRWPPAAAARATLLRPEGFIVKLQQHLHLRFGPVNMARWPAPAARGPAPAAQAHRAYPAPMVARGAPRARRAAPATSVRENVRPAALGLPRPMLQAVRRTAPIRARGAQLNLPVSTALASPRAASGAASAAPRNPVPLGRRATPPLAGRPAELARRDGAQAPARGVVRPAPGRPGAMAPPGLAARPRRPAALLAWQAAAQRTPEPLPLARAAPGMPSPAAPAPATLEWRRRSHGDASAPAPAQSMRDHAPARVARDGADSRATAAPPMFAARPGFTLPTLDTAAADRLAEDVVRRVERRLRIERERRGL